MSNRSELAAVAPYFVEGRSVHHARGVERHAPLVSGSPSPSTDVAGDDDDAGLVFSRVPHFQLSRPRRLSPFPRLLRFPLRLLLIQRFFRYSLASFSSQLGLGQGRAIWPQNLVERVRNGRPAVARDLDGPVDRALHEF